MRFAPCRGFSQSANAICVRFEADGPALRHSPFKEGEHIRRARHLRLFAAFLNPTQSTTYLRQGWRIDQLLKDHVLGRRRLYRALDRGNTGDRGGAFGRIWAGILVPARKSGDRLPPIRDNTAEGWGTQLTVITSRINRLQVQFSENRELSYGRLTVVLPI